jgi:hypothetical protein
MNLEIPQNQGITQIIKKCLHGRLKSFFSIIRKTSSHSPADSAEQKKTKSILHPMAHLTTKERLNIARKRIRRNRDNVRSEKEVTARTGRSLKIIPTFLNKTRVFVPD